MSANGSDNEFTVVGSSSCSELSSKKRGIDELTDTPLIAVEISGRDSAIWEKREPRFNERLTNSVKKVFGADIPPSATAEGDVKDIVDGVADAVNSKLKASTLINLEKQAAIKVKHAEVKEREANARLVNLQADKLALELEREQTHESQKMIDLLIQRGDLIMTECDGEIIFIYKG